MLKDAGWSLVIAGAAHDLSAQSVRLSCENEATEPSFEFELWGFTLFCEALRINETVTVLLRGFCYFSHLVPFRLSDPRTDPKSKEMHGRTSWIMDQCG